jgi:2-polyprenyl-6-methoxyphenol hydroxylase-like FAD-dependent oxidoreductase
VLGPVGAGLLLQPTGLWALWRMGLLGEALRHGARITRLFGDTDSGRAVMDMRYDALDRRLFGLGMQRGALFELLKSAWPDATSVRCGCAIDFISDDGTRLRDESGDEHGPYDLVVLADGSASKLRQITGAPKLDRPYPWGALWCLVSAKSWPWQAELRQRYRAASKMMGLLPVGSRPGDPEPRLSFFWSIETSRIDDWRRTGFETWRSEAATLWPEASHLVQAIERPERLVQASYRDATPKRWWRGPVVLIGDAAHAMSPQLGQGVNMALLDALVLSGSLRAEKCLADALARYARERRSHVRIYQFWSRWLTPLFQSDRRLPASVRDMTFLPMARLPGTRGQMLRILAGTQRGWFGQLRLTADFVEALGTSTDVPSSHQIAGSIAIPKPFQA